MTVCIQYCCWDLLTISPKATTQDLVNRSYLKTAFLAHVKSKETLGTFTPNFSWHIKRNEYLLWCTDKPGKFEN